MITKPKMNDYFYKRTNDVLTIVIDSILNYRHIGTQ